MTSEFGLPFSLVSVGVENYLKIRYVHHFDYIVYTNYHILASNTGIFQGCFGGQILAPFPMEKVPIFSQKEDEKSCYESTHIYPIRAEISTHEHWENVFMLLFVRLVVMGFRQNCFHISPNFLDFGATMSFFRYMINQKRKIFIKYCSPRVPKHHLYQRCVSI